MQFAPMITVIAATGHAPFGESVMAARLQAAFGGAALTAFVLLLARRLRGGRAAIRLVWLTVIGSNHGEAGALALYRDRACIPYPRSTAGDFSETEHAGPVTHVCVTVMCLSDAWLDPTLTQRGPTPSRARSFRTSRLLIHRGPAT